MWLAVGLPRFSIIFHEPPGEDSIRCCQMMYSTPSSSQCAMLYCAMASPSDGLLMKSKARPDGWPPGSAALARVPPMVMPAAPGTLETTAFAAFCATALMGPEVLLIFAMTLAATDAAGAAGAAAAAAAWVAPAAWLASAASAASAALAASAAAAAAAASAA